MGRARAIALGAEGAVLSRSPSVLVFTELVIRTATSIFAEATSFLGPAATGIANEVHEVVTNAYVLFTLSQAGHWRAY